MDLFINLLNMSIQAGWLIIAVILIRALFKNMPKWIRCVLWGLVAVRLVCPVTFESRLSLVPDIQVINLDETEAEQSHKSTLNVAGFKLPYAEGTYITTTLKDVYPANSDGEVISSGVIKNDDRGYDISKRVVSFVNKIIINGHSVLFAAVSAWIIGMMCLAAYAVSGYIKLRKIISEAVELNDAGLTYKVMIADAVKSPFIFGIINPKIYISSDFKDDDIKYIIAHEQAHLLRKDNIWKLTGYMLLTVYCFNPLIWAAYILFCRDIELACDEKVIRRFDSNEKKLYSNTLLSCSMQRRAVISCPLAFGEIAVKERIKAVLEHKKTKKPVLVFSTMLCVIVAVCFLTDPVTSNAKTWQQDEGVPTTVCEATEGYKSDSNTSIETAFEEASEGLAASMSEAQIDEYYTVTVPDNYSVTVKENDYSVTDDDFAIEQTTECFVEAVENCDSYDGNTFEEYFSQYEKFGIKYEETGDGNGRGSVYLNGELINTFIDIMPDGGVFTFQSAKEGSGSAAILCYENGEVKEIISVPYCDN